MNIDLNPIAIVTDQMEQFAKASIELAPGLIAATIFLILTWIVKKVVMKVFDKTLVQHSHMRPSLVRALKAIIGSGIWGVGILIAAMIAMPSLTPAKLLAGLGVGSIAIGLVFKDTFENFLAGLLILLRKSMRIDDYIECEGIEGCVKEITMRDTYIRKTNGELVIVPNGILYSNPLRVITDWDLRRITLVCGVAYDEDVDASREVIRKAVESAKTVSKEKPIQIFAKEFGASSIDFEVSWWTKSKPVDERESRDELVSVIKRALDDAGIEIPFPYRTMTFKEPLKIIQGSDK